MTSKRIKSFEIAECEEVRSSISLVQRYERHENQMKGCATELKVSDWQTSNGNCEKKTRNSCTGHTQCEVSATRVVVDAALRRIGKSRRGCHKNANISGVCERI